MAANDLTTLARAKTWLNTSAVSTDDVLLSRLISAASRFALNYINRDAVYRQIVTETVDGPGGDTMLLKQFPVVAITSLTVNGTAQKASPGYPNPNGYMLDAWDGFPPGTQQRLLLLGGCFPMGRMNVSVVYTCGYVITEALTIPATSPNAAVKLSVSAPNGPWMVDGGASINGVALTAQASVPTAPGQYQLTQDNPGEYVFWGSNTPQTVQVTYSYVPFDLESAVIELIAEKYRYKDRIGQTSKSFNGAETSAYTMADMHPNIKTLLQQFKRVVP